MQDMYQDGQLFTFLMPAAEKIYTPYDFRFVYDQDQTDLPANDNELVCECVDAGMCDASLMAEFFEENFADRWQVCAVRDSMYYQSLLFERQSERGGIKLLKKQGKLIGMFTYMQEEQLEIMEPLYLPGYEDVFCQTAAWMCRNTTEHSAVKVYAYCGGEAEKKPTIMVRILRLEKLLSSLKVRKGMQMDCSFAVLDAVLPQNSKIWRIQSGCTELPEEGNCTRHLQVRETEDSEGVLTIGALTSLLFGYKSVEAVAEEEDVILPKHLQEELKKIQPLQNVFLNELV